MPHGLYRIDCHGIFTQITQLSIQVSSLASGIVLDPKSRYTTFPAPMSQPQILVDIPELKLGFPPSKIATSALVFAQKHLDQGLVNHVARSAYWALIIAAKLPAFNSASIDMEVVVLICILHDMGLAFTKSNDLEGLTVDKRFEVDGANIARDFLQSHVNKDSWDEARLERLWIAIALHTTPSIARHADPEIALAQMAIEADFAGPYWSPGPGSTTGQPITVNEYRAVTTLFPRVDSDRESTQRLMCGLCQKKPGTTYDNFVGLFGLKYGVDGKGEGKDEYTRQWEEKQVIGPLLSGLDALDALDQSFQGYH